MKTILDTADINEIRKWYHALGKTIMHVTTNPHLLASAGINTEDKLKEFVSEIYKLNNNMTLFIQCMSIEAATGVYKLAQRFSKNIVAKVSMDPEFFPVIEEAKLKGLKTAATTCYDLIQIHQACEFEMDYSMVYFAKNDDETLLIDAVQMMKNYSNYKTSLIAASFRTKKDVMTAIKSGIEYATIPPKVLDLIYVNNDTKADIEKIKNEE